MCALGTVTRVSVSTRTVTAGVVVVVAIVVGLVVVIVEDPRQEAQGEATPAPGGSVSREPSATPLPSASPTPPAPLLLLPNMRSLRPSDLGIEVVGDERRLRFAASLANLGPGPLLLLPRGVRNARVPNIPLSRSCTETATPTACSSEVVTAQTAGAMWAACSATPATGTGTSTRWPPTPCDVPAPTTPWSPAPRSASVSATTGGCLANGWWYAGSTSAGARATASKESLSGWRDVYTADLDGQWLRLPRGVNDEVVCLDLKADPRGRLTETDEADNATSVAIRIDGTRVRRVNSAPCC